MDNTNNSNSIRLLASIMFTDIVGYTSLMQENEIKAKILIDRHRNVLDKIIPDYKGRILQFYGDGTLSIFGSVVETIECSLEIQKAMLNEPEVPLRIGIHIGDIIYGDDSIYGDGVNIASRIQAVGIKGSVLFSDKVFDEIKNHPVFHSKYIGLHELKNVKKPLKIYALSNVPLSIPEIKTSTQKTKQDIKSIAVLPFVNMSADKENEYFSDGITEELINSLANVEGVNITSRTSSFAFKGQSQDIRKIGSNLNVNYILEGSVRKAGDKVRITAQLINSANGYHLWSETFNRHLKDIFEVQDEISQTIAARLSQSLLGNVKKSAEDHEMQPESIEAYNLYLKGLFYWNKWTPGDIKYAIKCYEEALKIEPDFPKALHAITNAYIYLGALGYIKAAEAYPLAYSYCQKCLKIKPDMGEAFASMGVYKLFFEHDITGCYENFKKALALVPGKGMTHYTYSFYLLAMGKFEEALNELEYALQLDPLNLAINEALASCMSLNLRFKQSLLQYDRIIEMDPNFSAAILGKAAVFARIGEYGKAIEMLNRCCLESMYLKKPTFLAYIYAKAGDKDNAVKYINEIIKLENENPNLVLTYDKMMIYALLGDIENTYEYLIKAIEDNVGGIVFIYHSPDFRKVIKNEKINKVLQENHLIY